MEREEALKCINIALNAEKNGDKEKAERFLLKAQRFDSSTTGTVNMYLARLKSEKKSNSTHSATESTTRKRENTQVRTQEPPAEKPFTPEQDTLSKRINAYTDYYEILGLEKSCVDSDIKKAYRKLAKELHPDKNSAPHAEEAFKKVSQAYMCLSDENKRRRYDVSGVDSNQPHAEGNVYHTSMDEINPEDIFRAFFGMDSGHIFTHQVRRARARSRREPATSDGAFSSSVLFNSIISILPILLLLTSALFGSSFNSPEPSVYSFKAHGDYKVRRTLTLPTGEEVPYYVTRQFERNYGTHRRTIRIVEENVLKGYLEKLKEECDYERNHKQTLLKLARAEKDEHLKVQRLQEATQFLTPACDRRRVLLGRA